MIYRTWFCLNKHCRHEFTVADKENPPCPRCTGIHVKWLPKPVGIISGKTKQTDADVKGLQRIYGEKNYRSPVRGERAAPKVNPSLVPGQTARYGAPGAPGWNTEIPIDPNTGVMPGSYCGPTGVTAKLGTAIGNRTPLHKLAATPTGGIPRIEATHRGGKR